MNKKFSITFAILVTIIAICLWWFSDAQVLARRSAALIECVRFEPDTGRVQRTLKIEKVRNLTAKSITISYPEMAQVFQHAYATAEPVTLPQDNVKAALSYLTETSEWISAEDESIEVLNHNDSSAEVKVSFKLTAKLKGRAEQSAQLDGIFTFRSIENKWLLVEASF